jgi:hypothetical protein
MIDFEYRFPLFDSIMVGSLSPFLPENNYRVYLNEENDHIGLDSILDEGRVGFTFYKPANFKCRYYYHKLIQETFCYCNDILLYLEEEQDADTRAYLRLTLLDKHLKTCLIKIGETLHSCNLSTQHFLQPLPETDSELLSNSYIFHLLKVCVAKAYLEVQLALSDVIHNPLTETMLYTAMVGELPPIKCFLKQTPAEKLQKPSKAKATTPTEKRITEPLLTTQSETDQATASVGTIFYTVKDLIDMKIGSDRTIRRLLEKKELIGIKQKKGWLVEDTEYQRYFNNLKTKQHNKTKP